MLRVPPAPEPTRAKLLHEARDAASESFPMLSETAWRRYKRDGDRSEYESAYFARRRQVTALTLGTLCGAGDEAGELLADRVARMLEEITWCVPAHDGTGPEGDRDLPDPERPVIDLFASQTAGMLATVFAVLPEWSREHSALRRRMVAEVDKRVLEPFDAHAREYHWWARGSNWNPWVVANVLTAAELACRGMHLRRIVVLAVESLDAYFDAAPQDGSCNEGISYWWQSAARAFDAVQCVQRLVPGVEGLARRVPILARQAAYPRIVHLGGPWSANFGDTSARTPVSASGVARHVNPSGELFLFARAVGDEDGVRFARAARGDGPLLQTPGDLMRAVRVLADDGWREATNRGYVTATSFEWLPEVAIASWRVAEESAGVVSVVVKGGHNGDPHNHLDVGTFVVAVDGAPVIVDPGVGTYTRDSFGPKRYESWFTRSEFHCLPLIDHGEQGVGAPYASRAALHDDADDSVRLALDLGAVYPGLERTDSLVRRFTLNRRSAVLTVDDCWSLQRTPQDVRTQLMVAAEPRMRGGGVRLPAWGGGRGLDLTWTGEAHVEWECIPLDDRIMRNVWGAALWRLAVVADEPRRSNGVLSLRLTPEGEAS